ncbi:kinetochore complex Sim4 subunit Fta4 [Fusarium heterosporum]|uniref:Kinetochore complex Sim4 subunit Fta4 n=1 Tax=Fusarium heterosporum TaxID=42747 RepID=A0A8H5TJS6_FUSHE|nr:kinetochore complex Sim4 subunit Fta4 [Fusarium heterosporum]
MVNALTLIYSLTAVMAVQACKQTCVFVEDTGNHCTYNCVHACKDISAQQARNTFLTALIHAGHECSELDTSGVKCKKVNKFGACSGHYWSCGDDC